MRHVPTTKVALRQPARHAPTWLILAWLALGLWVIWSTTSTNAFGASDSANTNVGVTVDAAIALAPSLKKGTLDTQMPDISRPGQQKTEISDGWEVASSWPAGYSMWISSSTSPALRGSNAPGSDPSTGSFSDHKTGGCPCNWTTGGADRGVFGYTISGSSNFVDRDKWGTEGSRKWRGFTKGAYKIADGFGEQTWWFTLHFRSEVPQSTIQPAGDYRANLLLSFTPNA